MQPCLKLSRNLSAIPPNAAVTHDRRLVGKMDAWQKGLARASWGPKHGGAMSFKVIDGSGPSKEDREREEKERDLARNRE